MTEAALDVQDLTVVYPAQGRTRHPVRAVTGVSLSLQPGETLGLVGESGCGKSTLARALVGLERSTGDISLGGDHLLARRTPEQARRIQIIFQDPYASLNPRLSVRSTLEEMVRVHRLRPRREIPHRVGELVALVGLPPASLEARPAALSGGQRQRVAIARALALQPDVLVADEPTTSLDVSVQAVILDLFAQVRDQLGLALLLITHNVGVVSAVCDRVAVMYLGRIVELAPTVALLNDPRHPYTRRLLAAVPRLGAPAGVRAALQGDPPDPSQVPGGCPFHPRCPDATDHCATARPELSVGQLGANGAAPHLAACHYAWAPPGAEKGVR
ncbi:MAG: ABC transporter ATP-binding protein [Candidatus Dormiibacterota bacterium]